MFIEENEFEMSSAHWQPSWLDLNVLTKYHVVTIMMVTEHDDR